MKIVPSSHVDCALRRTPIGGKIFQLLALNHDRHGLATDLQHDHLARSHARNLTRNVGQPWVPRRSAVGVTFTGNPPPAVLAEGGRPVWPHRESLVLSVRPGGVRERGLPGSEGGARDDPGGLLTGIAGEVVAPVP